MRIRLTWIAALIAAAWVLAACNMLTSPGPAGGNATAAPAGNATPGGRGGPGGTPGAGRPGGPPANATPAANATPKAPVSGTPFFAATRAPVGSQPAGSNNAAPTQVPRPTVLMPTIAPASTPTPKPATPVAIPYTPVPMGPVATIVPLGGPVSLDAIRGKILFMTDREGYPQLYMMNADGSNQQACNCADLLEGLADREMSSPDGKQFLFYRVAGGRGDQQIWSHNNETGLEARVAGMSCEVGNSNQRCGSILNYDAVWSPNIRYIAYVTNANQRDEIYLYDAVENSNVRLTESSTEWYKHPTFSPDGSQIAYWTNVESALRKQVWVMNLDGSGKRNISNNEFNDYSPIWVR